MSDSEDDYNSGEDGDYVPSGEGDSDDDYDKKDGKNATFVHNGFEVTTDEDEESSAPTKKRKKNNKHSHLNRNKKRGIKIDDGTENVEIAVKTKEEIEPLDGLADNLAAIKEHKLEEKKKERADNLWSDFMKDVGLSATSKVKESAASTSIATASMCDVDVPKNSTTNIKEKKTTVTVTKLFDFAGETVEVKEEVDCSSKNIKQVNEITEPATSRGLGIKRSQGGLGNLLNKITKKTKISTLEKSKLDWNSFKQKEGIDDDLKLYNKGKNGFLEKRDFLDRANQRQYEIEKTFKLGLKKTTR